ncbi:AAA family ATPase [Anaerosinus massiliensis]|uniref:AAA family ATPase n=1 Tax=Massilibacillus massiliensis TaxID=1806837 RepID=UPI000ABB82C0|nr:AAA family ATPase [Massilibacillus massiliensis]
MKLLSLKLKNFKGIREFELITNGTNIDIFGDNATGKTTIFDALIWLLFNKDSQNRNDFEIKTLDQAGSAIHRLEHEVEGKFLIDGRAVTLRKVYKEKWTRRRGQAIENFDGHTTDYFIDDVPLKTKREYDSFISNLVDEKVFKLLTNPLFFNENIEWGERRNIILEICGDVSADEVLEKNEMLVSLKQYLNEGKSIADLKAMASAKQSKINAELKMIPVRISELQNSLQEVSTENVNEIKLQADLGNARQLLESKNQEILLAENGGAVTQFQIEIKQIDSQIQGLINNLNAVNNEKKEQLQEQFFNLNNKKNELSNLISSNEYKQNQLNDAIKKAEDTRNELLAEWNQINCQEFLVAENTNDCTCGFCGQALPSEMIEASREKVEKEREGFNLNKANRLQSINERGKNNSEKIADSNQQLAQLAGELAVLKSKLELVEKEISQISTELESVKNSIVTTSPAAGALKRQQDEIRIKINDIQNTQVEVIENLKSDRIKLQNNIVALEGRLASFNQFQSVNKRIKELEEQQVKLAVEYEQLTQQIYLTEEFTKRKVDMLQERINSKFALARFKMFKENVTNDGIAECCETTFNGVSYKDLNNAAKINVGLDIIRTLAAYYKFEAPIFVDNAEAVTKLISLGDTQIIRLVVSEQDKVLRIDCKDNVLKEAI